MTSKKKTKKEIPVKKLGSEENPVVLGVRQSEWEKFARANEIKFFIEPSPGEKMYIALRFCENPNENAPGR